jgi:hypothetical protein
MSTVVFRGCYKASRLTSFLARNDARAMGAQFEIFEIPPPYGRQQFEEVVAARGAAAER